MPPSDQEMAYAVHTESCTYLLDQEGVCRWIVSQQGVIPRQLRQCIGAQFVASLDFDVEGGLVGDLHPGGKALFVRQADDRLVLLRTGEILRVDDRRKREQPTLASPPAAVMESRGNDYGKRAGVPIGATPRFGTVQHSGDGQTVTVTVSLSSDWPRKTVKR